MARIEVNGVSKKQNEKRRAGVQIFDFSKALKYRSELKVMRRKRSTRESLKGKNRESILNMLMNKIMGEK